MAADSSLRGWHMRGTRNPPPAAPRPLTEEEEEEARMRRRRISRARLWREVQEFTHNEVTQRTIQEEVRPFLSDEKRTLITEWMAEMDRDIASVDRAIERGIDYGDTPHSMDFLDDRRDG